MLMYLSGGYYNIYSSVIDTAISLQQQKIFITFYTKLDLFDPLTCMNKQYFQWNSVLKNICHWNWKYHIPIKNAFNAICLKS